MAAHGKDQVLQLDVTAGGSLTAVTTYMTNFDFPREIETLETTTAGDDSRTYIKGLKNATFSVEFEYDNTLVDYLEVLYADTTSSSQTFSFKWYPTGSGQNYTGEAYITALNMAAPIGLETVSTEWQVTGDVTKADS